MSISYIQVPQDGSGKKVYTTETIISGVTIHVQNMNIVNSQNTDNVNRIDNRGTLVTKFHEGDPLMASYGDLKTTNNNILGVYEHTVDSYDDLYTIDEISGGTSTFEINESSVMLSVTNDPGSRCTRTTNRYHYYQVGTSLMCIIIN